MGRDAVKADPLLPLYREQHGARAGWDRLELLTALINSPAFDQLFRAEVIRVPARHPVFRWACLVAGCERPRKGSLDMCHIHNEQWAQARDGGVGKAGFLTTAQPLGPSIWVAQVPCRICPDRPATHTRWLLCHRHTSRWYHHQRGEGQQASFGDWLAAQSPFGGYGTCQVAACPDLAATPLGLCSGHQGHYRADGRPGGAALPQTWSRTYELQGRPVPVSYRDEEQFRGWCASQPPMPWPGQINLLGLAALAAAEIRWGLFAHTQRQRHTRWDTGWVQALANTCRARGTGSLTELDLSSCTTFAVLVAREILHDLRLAYFTPETSRDAGFIETDHFGVRFHERGSHFDLTGISQRWLRDLLWDYLAGLLSSPDCPRTGGTFDAFRRAATELGAFLAVDAPGGGHDPALLAAAHIQRFAADQRHREREGLASLAMRRQDGTPSIITTTTRAITFNHARKLLRWALDCGAAEQAGLSREFITAMPAAGPTPVRKRSPFPDEVARALADEASLARLAGVYDPSDFGLRDMWETIIVTGRRVSEVLGLRLDCTGRYGGLAMLWHDQTKVGRYDQAIRIPEPLSGRLAQRREPPCPGSSPGTAAHPRPLSGRRWRCSPAATATRTGPPLSPTSGSTCGSRPGSMSSTSADGFPTRPGTRWPPACCATARPSPTSAATSGTSPTGWPSTTSTLGNCIRRAGSRRIARSAWCLTGFPGFTARSPDQAVCQDHPVWCKMCPSEGMVWSGAAGQDGARGSGLDGARLGCGAVAAGGRDGRGDAAGLACAAEGARAAGGHGRAPGAAGAPVPGVHQ
jgi:hypothetical protein